MGLVHYLQLGNSLGRQKLGRYLELLASNRDPEAAASEAFGNLATLEKLLPSEQLAHKAALLARGGSLELARPLIDEALALDPHRPMAHEVEGYYFLQTQDLEAAHRSFGKAIELGTPSFLAPYYDALLVLRLRAPIEQAFARLESAIASNERFVPAHLMLAELASEWGTHLDEALDSAERAVDLAPRSPEARRALAIVQAARGDLKAAVRAYRNAAALAPRSPVLKAELGQVLADAGESEEAIEAFRGALALAPEAVALNQPLALQLVELERYEEAASAFDKLEGNAPDDAELYHAMAKAFAGAGRVDEALAAFREAENLDPYEGVICADHAAALEKAGRHEDAVDAYRRAIELEPDEGGFHYGLAVALEQLGRIEEAKEHFAAAQRLGFRR